MLSTINIVTGIIWNLKFWVISIYLYGIYLVTIVYILIMEVSNIYKASTDIRINQSLMSGGLLSFTAPDIEFGYNMLKFDSSEWLIEYINKLVLCPT